MNNLVPTRVNPDYYYSDKKISDLDLLELENEDEIKEPIKYTVKQRFIAISSLDRDWYNNASSVNPFNYTVKIGDNGKFTLLNDIKNIVSLQISKMILPNKSINIEYSNNTFNLSNEPYFVVELDEFNNVTDGTNSHKNKATAIMNSLTPISNVVSELSHLEYKNINNSIKKFSNPVSNLNQITIKIKNQLEEDPMEINDILTIENIFSSDNNTIDDNDDDTDNDPEPINLLNVLNVKTTTYFNNQYKIGDIIKCQGYVFRDTAYAAATNFNDFINRSKGHRIIDLKNSEYSYFMVTQATTTTTITQYKNGDTHYNDRNFTSGDTNKIIVYEDGTTAIATFSSTTALTSSIFKTITSPQRIYLKPAAGLVDYYNTIVISIPYTISTSNIVKETWWSTLKQTSTTDQNATASGDSGGKLINTHLQSHLFINVSYLEYENVVTSQLI
jgi:hypothetical protein